MTSDAPDYDDIFTTCDGQISPGCPTADAVLDGHSGRPQLRTTTPAISHRASFSPMIPPDRTRNPFTFLHPGSFVLFQLDNRELATLIGVPEQSELFQHCLEFPTKRYPGLVLGSFGGESDPDAQPYTIAFVSQSPPPGSGCGGEDDFFAIPIAPTKPENTNDREPLYPKPFPWIGCYQYTILGARITPTHTYPSALEYRLSEEDFEAFEVNFGVDSFATTSFPSQEDEILFRNMRTLADSFPLPVKVWQELGAEQVCQDPRDFVEEVLNFQAACVE